VRLGLETLVDLEHRRRTGQQIAEAYRRQPQSEHELAGLDEAGRMFVRVDEAAHAVDPSRSEEQISGADSRREAGSEAEREVSEEPTVTEADPGAFSLVKVMRIREVPDDVHDALLAVAKDQGMSLTRWSPSPRLQEGCNHEGRPQRRVSTAAIRL
jgi:hypothetical protein